MNMDTFDFIKLINGSIQYEMDGGVLEIIGYYSGKRVKLDLNRLNEEMLDELIVTDEEEED
jgi:hypothetical protein